MVLKRATFTDFARGWSNEGANVKKSYELWVMSYEIFFQKKRLTFLLLTFNFLQANPVVDF